MPNRILRDWTDSYRFDGISAEAERLFVRLIMKADDFGNFHGDERIVESLCFPLGVNPRSNDRNPRSNDRNPRTSENLQELCERKLISFYQKDGRKYLSINNFNQRLRTHTRKFPDPMTADCCHVADNPRSNDRNPPLEEKGSRREVEVEVEEKRTPPTRDPLAPLEDPLQAPLVGSLLAKEKKRKEMKGNNTLKNRREAPVADAPVFPSALDCQEFRDCWEEYVAYRREAKLSPLLPRSVTAKLNEMSDWGLQAAIQAIRATIANQWQGIFPPKSSATSQPNHRNEKRNREFHENIAVPILN